jgi:thiamine-phosphate pyrophosphorylase
LVRTDANFNRAREALRVMEEYCRFALNSGVLSERAKGLRHELCAAVGRLDGGRLLAGRDTLGDVGVGQKVEGQLQRANLKDCLPRRPGGRRSRRWRSHSD